MKQETEESLNENVREIFEPRYGRKLSDEEVYEIRTNLRTFAEAIITISERLQKRGKKD